MVTIKCSCGECKRCKHRDYMRAWYQSKTPEQRRAWVARRDPEAIARKEAKQKGTPTRRASLNANGRRMRMVHPEKYQARYATNNAIRDGRLTRQPCGVCGGPGQAHHPDYSKPLEVLWLCGTHHRAEHGR